MTQTRTQPRTQPGPGHAKPAHRRKRRHTGRNVVLGIVVLLVLVGTYVVLVNPSSDPPAASPGSGTTATDVSPAGDDFTRAQAEHGARVGLG